MSAPVLVIGSNSFSGSSFIRYLLNNEFEVLGTSRSNQPSECFLPYKWVSKVGHFKFHKIDLNEDLTELVSIIKRNKIKIIVNFAAQSMVGQSWDYPEHWFQTNVVSSVKLQNELRKLDFIEKYVHVTTPEVYGSTEGFIKEDTPFNPSTPYAVSRAAGDMSLKCFIDAYDFPAIMTRAANVYGPGQQLYRIIPRTIFGIRVGKKLRLDGGGASIRSFIHMDDVSDATWRLTESNKTDGCYHISDNRLITIRGLVELICEMMNVDFDEHVEMGQERLGKDSAYKLNSDRLITETGWSPTITLENGIEQTIEWCDKHILSLQSMPTEYIHKQ